MHGKPGSLASNVSVDPRPTAVPTLIDAALLMPMRIQHIRVPESDDNSQLVGLVRQLIGLEPLLDVAGLADKLTYRNRRFLKYAKDNDSHGKAERVSRTSQEAQEKRVRSISFGQAATRQALQSRKSAQRLFLMRNSTASRGCPLSTSGTSHFSTPKNGAYIFNNAKNACDSLIERTHLCRRDRNLLSRQERNSRCS